MSKSETMVIEMEKQSVSIIKSFKDIDETMYPEKDLSESNRYLPGFKWHDEARPKDKDDIFRRVEVEMPKVEETPKETPKEAAAEEEVQEVQPKRHRERKKME